MEIGEAVLIPLTVIGLDVKTVLNAAFVCGVKLNGSGVVSAAKVVTLKAPFTPPMVSVAVVSVEKLAEEVW